jgi:hypothetical protein
MHLLKRVKKDVTKVKEVGTKKDEGKPRWSILPMDAMIEVIRVFMYGDIKYNGPNYTLGMNFTRIVDANMRHLTKWVDGEDNDPETGRSHIAHAACGSLMLLALIIRGFGPKYDDRIKYTKG